MILKYTFALFFSIFVLTASSGSAPTLSEPVSSGDDVPDIELTNLKGETVALEELEGKVVFLYFWASWCKPCRNHTPQFPQLYQKYKNATFKEGKDGFEIYMVSLDKRKRKWKRAIKQDGLKPLINVSDLKGWESKAVEKFDLESIPRSFLLNGKGEVLAEDVKMDNLKFMLKQLKE